MLHASRRSSVVGRQASVAKLRAAVDARGDDDLVIIARTDARAPLGLEEASRRGKRETASRRQPVKFAWLQVAARRGDDLP